MPQAPLSLVLALALLASAPSAAEVLPPLPAEAEQAVRLKALKEIYKDEYARRKADERSAFARTLLAQGLATADPIERVVFLREAQDVAAKGGDLTTGLEAIAALAAGFAIDPREERLRYYAAITPAISTLEGARAVIEGQLDLVDQAVAIDDYPLAVRAATQADAFARRLKDGNLSARTQPALERAKALAAEFAALPPLRDLLGELTVPGHAAYGRFACLAKGDWENGLAHLAQGDDEALTALARDEIAATSAEARLASADAWHDWAQKQKAKVRSAGLAHAADLYRRSLTGLSGLTKARVDKRLAELDKLLGARGGMRYPDGAALLLTFEPATIDGAIVWDQSPHRHQGRIVGAKPSKGPWGAALEFDGLTAVVTVANHPSLQTAGSSTLVMWLRPAELGVRRNPWNKAFGGEGTWTLEPTGAINGYYGTAGTNGDPYTQATMTTPVAVGEWTHVALVRDLDAKLVTWYRNGTMVTSVAVIHPEPKASPTDVTIGGGYVGRFVGLIDEVGLWPRALGAKEISAIHDGTLSGRK